MTQSLAGKVALITGASSGIGEAMARAMAAAGCKLTLAARSLDKLNALADELDCATLAVGADMTQPAEIQTMVARTIEAFGTVDVLFANDVIYIPGDFGDGDMDALARLLTINVEAVMRCAHAVIPHMRAQANGDIVVTSSIAGFSDIHWEPVYSASKNAIQTFVHTLRRQLAGDGIRVMSLAPGQVANPLWGFYEAAEIERVSQGERTHLTSEDCADALLFMLSQPAHVTIRDLVILPQNQVNV
ncbi:MAG: SDR family oxidoreductase [Chloroflexi bacterium]|nr:SDR family oxidoreductase [Chloroflexota bacterium]